MVAEYLLFHYGTERDILDPEASWPEGMREALDFAVRTQGHFRAGWVERGLDLGCAVGRSAYEMSKTCGAVIGIDYSEAFVEAAKRIGEGHLQCEKLEEGHVRKAFRAELPEGCAVERASFFKGDAMDLPAGIGEFDRVHAANLLCRLPDPELLLKRLPELVKAGGELVLATPCTWLEEFTPSSKWPRGDTFSWLEEALGGCFQLTRRCEEPFLIRETARKFQWTRAMTTVWRRNGAG